MEPQPDYHWTYRERCTCGGEIELPMGLFDFPFVVSDEDGIRDPSLLTNWRERHADCLLIHAHAIDRSNR